MRKTEYHVSAGLFGIYAGELNTTEQTWRNKSEVTDEALAAVRDYMTDALIKDGQTTGGYEWTKKDGTVIELRVTIRSPEEAKND